jgi:hypothetical protein
MTPLFGQSIVTPAQAGVQAQDLDSRLRGNDVIKKYGLIPL